MGLGRHWRKAWENSHTCEGLEEQVLGTTGSTLVIASET